MVGILQYTYYRHDSSYLNIRKKCLSYWTPQNTKGLVLKAQKCAENGKNVATQQKMLQELKLIKYKLI